MKLYCRKPRKHNLNQAIKVDITGDQPNCHALSPDVIHEGTHNIACDVPAKSQFNNKKKKNHKMNLN